jgi:hypothetical protein
MDIAYSARFDVHLTTRSAFAFSMTARRLGAWLRDPGQCVVVVWIPHFVCVGLMVRAVGFEPKRPDLERAPTKTGTP